MTSIKTLFMIVFLSISIIAYSSTFFVSTSGSDFNPGSKEQPFKTLNKAWSVISRGDTIFMRAGNYNNSIMPATTYFRNKNGTSTDPIVIINYQNEKPVLDYSDATFTAGKCGFCIENVEYLHIKGIRITNINQPITGNIAQYGIILWSNVSNCVFEQIETDHIGGWGITIGDNCNNNLFLNCDSHNNADPYSAVPYGWADGFQSGSPSSTNNIFRGCRAWANSDDGWDFRLYDGSVILDSCWSFRNGFKPNTWEHGGNGEGFKLGIKRLPSTNSILRTLVNCIAFDNYSIGFHSSTVAGYGTFKSILYNNTAFRNGILSNSQGFCFVQPEVENTLKNNLSINNPRDYVSNININTNNSWNKAIIITESDFQSLDTAGVSGARNDNGDLPDLPFLKLSQTSGLVDAGINIGQPFSGQAPDLGAFEMVPPASGIANQNPVVSISSPLKNTSFTSPASITVEAVASDPDGTIIKVEFFQGTVKLGERITAPYSFTWKEVPEGTYSLSAVAIDNKNSKTVSASISIIVIKPVAPVNQLPIVSISSPTKGSLFTSPATIILDINASDPDGLITKVEIFNGEVKLDERITAPYLFTLKELPAGSYVLKAVATDNMKATSTSSFLDLVVTSYNEAREFFNLYPNPNDGRFSIDFTTLLEADIFTVSVVDLIGKTVYREEFSKDESTRQFDLSHLKNGIYVLMISANQILLTQKFIKG